jgi:hypothetical protein
MVAMMLSAHKVPLPASEASPLEGIDDVELLKPSALPPGSVAQAPPAGGLQYATHGAGDE